MWEGGREAPNKVQTVKVEEVNQKPFLEPNPTFKRRKQVPEAVHARFQVRGLRGIYQAQRLQMSRNHKQMGEGKGMQCTCPRPRPSEAPWDKGTLTPQPQCPGRPVLAESSPQPAGQLRRRRPGTAAQTPARPHQCQLFTLVPSSRSSTIQRGSPWPHLAMSALAARPQQRTRQGRGAGLRCG